MKKALEIGALVVRRKAGKPSKNQWLRLPETGTVPDELVDLLPRPRRLHQFFEQSCDRTPAAIALVCGLESFTYGELDARANRLARYLASHGAGPGKTVGILLARSAHTYAALLAVLKTGAAFVPIDAGCPADRVSFIAKDAGLSLVVSTSDLLNTHKGLPCRAVALDQIASELAAQSPTRLPLADTEDALAYIIYTSGTTGRPKGVAVRHSNICHFLAVCTPIYDVIASDRVYQGMTIAFDFSIEEIWPAFHAGATLVAGPTDGRRLGPGLAEFLTAQKVTVLCCVPTLLATLDRDVPGLHTLIVGGEECPANLVARWSRSGRRILNTYGPTETTVTASWTELEPGKPVTIGRPMPGYRIYILDENLRPAVPNEPGEICIGGAGVAQGYLNRPELTAAKFVPDPFEPDRPGARVYRSGDLGRFLPSGEVEFLGRIDGQVKIRGHRIELGEIEAVLLEDPDVENAVVTLARGNNPAQDLIAYITLRTQPVPVEALRERLAEQLRRRLPAYMLPAFLEVLDEIPTLASGKADLKQLPPPVSPRLMTYSGEYIAPSTPLEEKLAGDWRKLFGHDHISVEADFFLEMGGHSLLAAQLISGLRANPDLRRLGIADLYEHPTIRALAGHLETVSQQTDARPERRWDVLPHSSFRVWAAGAAQFGLLYALLTAFASPIALFLAVHGRGMSWPEFHPWDLGMLLLLVLVHFTLPVVVKWTLIGRFRAGRYPLWGEYYCRWWLVRKALDFSPLTYLAGSPLAPTYLRLLGARIGRNCHIASPLIHLPDLIDIGDGASIGYEAELMTFAVEDGWLELAPIRVGEDAFIGTKSVIMPGAEVGRRARVIEQTLVTRGQCIPDRERWGGSPARPMSTSDSVLDPIESQPAPEQGHAIGLWTCYAAAVVLLEMLPVLTALPGMLLIARAYRLHGSLCALAATPLAGLSFVLVTCCVIALGKRIAMPAARPGIYPIHSIFGFRKWASDKLMLTSLSVTNTLYATLYAVPWLRVLGARIGAWSEVSTVSHIDPDLLRLGQETFIADIASVGAATFHRGFVALGWTEIGRRTFVGNAAVIRSQTQLPDNCLIGVQSLPPEKAPEPGTSWLGSPAIFLPRREVCGKFDETVTYRPRPSLVAYRLAVEFVRIVLPLSLLYLFASVVALASFHLLAATSTAALIAATPALYFSAAVAIAMLVAGLKWAIVGRYRPRVEPLWAPFVRHSELITGLYESVTVPLLGLLLTGTPWLAPLLRLLGARVGRRVYMETTYLTEFDLVQVGDDASIGRASSLQSHLFEDRVMKMSTVRVGNGCTVGPRSVVLYDSSLQAGSALDGLSLVMKGESLPAGTSWRGVPARLVE
jgi:non-ribosomal peptide synthetase-like protein